MTVDKPVARLQVAGEVDTPCVHVGQIPREFHSLAGVEDLVGHRRVERRVE